MKIGKKTTALFIAVLSITTIAQTHQGIDSQAALQKLVDGNKRYAEAKRICVIKEAINGRSN